MPFPAPARRGAPGTVRASHSTLLADGENPSHSRPHRADALAAKTAERAGRSGGGPSRSHGSPGCVEVLPELPASSTARGPFRAPGLLGEGPEVGGFSSAPASGPSLAPRASGSGAAAAADLRSQRASRRGCPGSGAGTARRCPAQGLMSDPRRSAPRRGRHSHHPSPQPAVAPATRGLQPRTRSPGRVPLLRSQTRFITPGRGKESPRPAPASSGPPQSGSSLSYSQSGNSTRGWVTEQSAKSFPPLAPEDIPPRAKLTSAHRAAGSGTRSKSQHHALSLRGLPVTLASLRLARQEDGRKEESDLKSHSSSLPPFANVARGAAGGTRAAQPPHAGTGSAARPASLGAKRLVS